MARDTEITISPSLLRLATNTEKGIHNYLKEGGDRIETNIKRLSSKDSFVDRTGAARRSIKRDKVDMKDKSVKVIANLGTIGSKTDPIYPTFLNDGTKNKDGSTRIKPREFMETGLKKFEPDAERLLVKHLGIL
jgi:hypothetical protein